jgi:hypothetical protein
MHAPDFVLRGEPDPPALVVLGWVDAEKAADARREVAHRDQVDAACLRAKHTEVVDFSVVITANHARVGMVAVVAAEVPHDRAGAKSARLALHLPEFTSIVDDDVVACVLAKREQNAVAELTQDGNDCQRRPISYVDWMFHSVDRADAIGWAVS